MSRDHAVGALVGGLVVGALWFLLDAPDGAPGARVTPVVPITHDAPLAPPGDVTLLQSRADEPLVAAPPLAPSPPATPLLAGPRGVVYGRVTAGDGRAISEEVALTFSAGEGGAAHRVTARGGHYAVSGLAPGEWTLTTGDVTGFAPYTARLRLDEDAPWREHDVVLERSLRVLVKVVEPDGTPIHAGARPLTAVATAQPIVGSLPPTRLSEYQAWEESRFLPAHDPFSSEARALPADVLGRLDVALPPPFEVSLLVRHVVIDAQTVSEPDATVTFVLPPGRLHETLATLRLHVVDEAGAPVRHAVVEISDAQTSRSPKPVAPDGTFVAEELPPGLSDVEIKADGHETWLDVVELGPGEARELRVVLAPATTIAGHVVTRDGSGVATSLCVVALERRDSAWGPSRQSAFMTSKDGSFRIGGVGRGGVVLSVRDLRWAGVPLVVDTRAGDVSGLRLEVAEGRPCALRPGWSRGVGLAGVLLTDDGRFVDRRDAWLGGRTWTPLLVPGAYTLLVEDPRAGPRESRLVVGDEPVALNVD